MANKQNLPQQLPLLSDDELTLLFQLKDGERDKYSNTIELYDAIPKYVWGRRPNPEKNPHLDPIKRVFEHRGHEFKVTLRPARIEDKDGVDRDYFPGKTEELVEDAMRKIAADGAGKMLRDGYASPYSLYGIQKELSSMGHNFNIPQIKRAIQVLNRTSMSIECTDDQNYVNVVEESLFGKVGWRSKKDWNERGKDSDNKSFVVFHSLVDRSIKMQSFRRIDYEKAMSFDHNLSRYLFKRLSHNYTQADSEAPYDIGVRTIYRNAGMAIQKSISTNYKKLEPIIAELIAKKVIVRCDRLRDVHEKNNPRKIHDIILRFIPHPDFVKQVLHANQTAREVEMRADMYDKRNRGQLPGQTKK